MNREDIKELHYIAPIANLESILTLGILSHNGAKQVVHRSIALEEIQVRRSKKWIPSGFRVHDCVNLYFDARNPMMSRRRDEHHSIVVLSIDSSVLDLSGVCIADGNAGSKETKFYFADDTGFSALRSESVYLQNWNDPDPEIKSELRRQRCAEVLVPQRVPTEYIIGGYCSGSTAQQSIIDAGCKLPVRIYEHLFFL